MKKIIIGTVCSVMLTGILSGCVHSFAYPAKHREFSVLSAADSPQKSEQRAYKKAMKVCRKHNLQTKVQHVDRVNNNVDRVTMNGKTVYLPSEYQAHDHFTIMQVVCVKPPKQPMQTKSK